MVRVSACICVRACVGGVSIYLNFIFLARGFAECEVAELLHVLLHQCFVRFEVRHHHRSEHPDGAGRTCPIAPHPPLQPPPLLPDPTNPQELEDFEDLVWRPRCVWLQDY